MFRKLKNKNYFSLKFAFVVVFFVLLILSLDLKTAFAGINKQLNYQGRINTISGSAVPNGTYYIKLALYDVSSGGTCLWTAVGSCADGNIGTTTVSVVNGIFSVPLGGVSQNSLATSTIDWDSDELYLGVAIRGTAATPVYDDEMTPRKRLTASVYAFNADMIDGIHATSTAAVANYLVSLDANKILNLYDGGVSSTYATTTQFFVGTSDNPVFNVNANNYINVGTTTLAQSTFSQMAFQRPYGTDYLNSIFINQDYSGSGLTSTSSAARVSMNDVGTNYGELYFGNKISVGGNARYSYFEAWDGAGTLTYLLNGIGQYLAGNSTTTGSTYLGTTVGLSGEYISQWSDLSSYLSISSGNPFDQWLDTTSTVQFSTATSSRLYVQGTSGNCEDMGIIFSDSVYSSDGSANLTFIPRTVASGIGLNSNLLVAGGVDSFGAGATTTLLVSGSLTTLMDGAWLRTSNFESSITPGEIIPMISGYSSDSQKMLYVEDNLGIYDVDGDGAALSFMDNAGNRSTLFWNISTPTNEWGNLSFLGGMYLSNGFEVGKSSTSTELGDGWYDTIKVGAGLLQKNHVGDKVGIQFSQSASDTLLGYGVLTGNISSIFTNELKDTYSADLGFFTQNFAASTTPIEAMRLTPTSSNSMLPFYARNSLSVTGNSTTTGSSYLGSTAGLNGVYINDWSDIATIAGSWGTSTEQYFWNNTSTWSGFASQFAQYFNATTTLNGFDPSLYFLTANFGSYWENSYNATTTLNGFNPLEYLLISDYITYWNNAFNSTTTWAAYDDNWARNYNATSTFGGNLSIDGNATTTGSSYLGSTAGLNGVYINDWSDIGSLSGALMLTDWFATSTWAGGNDLVVSGTATSTFAGNVEIAQGKNLQVETIFSYSPLNVNTDLVVSGNATTTGYLSVGNGFTGAVYSDNNLLVDGSAYIDEGLYVLNGPSVMATTTLSGLLTVNSTSTRNIAAHCSDENYDNQGDCETNGGTWYPAADYDFITSAESGGYNFSSIFQKNISTGVYGYATSTDYTLGGETISAGVFGLSSDFGVIGLGGSVAGLFYSPNQAIYAVGESTFIGAAHFYTNQFNLGAEGNPLLSISATSIGVGQYSAPSEFLGVQPSVDAGEIATARFKTWNNTDQLFLDSTGRVGVATTTPGGYYGEKLTVVGGAYIQGGLYVDGIKNDLLPAFDDTYSLGSSDKRWSNIWGHNLNIYGTATVTQLVANNIHSDLNPSADLTYSLGTSTARWDEIWANSINITGTTTLSQIIIQNGLNFSGSLEKLADDLELPHKLRNIYTADGYVYAITYATDSVNSFRIIDVSNPSKPRVVGGEGLSGLPLSDGKRVWVSGNYAYLLYNATGGLKNPFRIVDVSDKSNPVVVGGQNLYFDTIDTTPGQPFYVSGKYAYILGSTNLFIVDISDPYDPKLVSSLNGVGFTNWDIKVQGDYAYVCSRKNISGENNPLTIVNIKDKKNPFITKEMTFPTSDLDPGSYCWSLDVSGAYVYLGLGEIGVNPRDEIFRIVDVSDPYNPVSVGGANVGINDDPDFELPESAGTISYLKVFGTRVYATAWNGYFLVMDVASSTNPKVISKNYINDPSYATTGWPVTFDVKGKHVYVGYAPIMDYYATSTGYFRIFDLPGADIWGGHSDAFSAGSLQVLNNAVFNQRLTVLDSLEIGSGGLYSQGALSVLATSTSSYFGGYLGLGTTTPNYRLVVNASNTTDYLFQVASSTHQGIFEIRNDGIARFGYDFIVNGTATSTFAGNIQIAQGKNLQVENIFAYSPLNINTDLKIFGNATTTGDHIVNGTVRATTLTLGGVEISSWSDIISAADLWATSTEQYFWNNTSTWSGYDSNWARNYNATSTFGGDLTIGGAATTTGQFVAVGGLKSDSIFLNGTTITNWSDLGDILGARNPFNQWLDSTSSVAFATTTVSGQLTASSTTARLVAAHCSSDDYDNQGDCESNGETWYSDDDHQFTTIAQTSNYGYFPLFDNYFSAGVYGYSTSTDYTNGGIGSVGVYGKASTVGLAGVSDKIGGFFYGGSQAIMAIGNSTFMGSGIFMTNSFYVGSGSNSLLSINSGSIGLGQYTAPSEFFGVQPSTDAGEIATARFKTWDNVDQLFLGSNGSVGVGTTTPGGYYGEKLTVVGNSYFQGNSTTTGRLVVTDTSTLATTTMSYGSKIGNLSEGSYMMLTTTNLNDPGNLGVSVGNIPVISFSNSSEIINNHTGGINSSLIILEDLFGSGSEDPDSGDLPTLTFASKDISTLSAANIIFATTTTELNFTGASKYNFDADVYANGILLTGADYAEYFYTKDTDLLPGEAVCMDVTKDNTISRCTRLADSNIIGIVSSKPAITGNNNKEYINNPNYKIIGLLGQVPAKVSTENGQIRPGDSLAAGSVPGYLAKANAGDSTVGVALEGLESGNGIVNVLISRRNKSLTVEEIETQITDRIAQMEIEDEVNVLISNAINNLDIDQEVLDAIAPELISLEAKINLSLDVLSNSIDGNNLNIKNLQNTADDFDLRINNLEDAVESFQDFASSTNSLLVAFNSDIVDLQSQNLEMSQNWQSATSSISYLSAQIENINQILQSNAEVETELTVSQTDLSINNLSVSESATFYGTILVKGEAGFEHKVTFYEDIIVKGKIYASKDQAGTAIIPAGQTSVDVVFGQEYLNAPKVVANINDDDETVFANFKVARKSSKGFSIVLQEALEKDVAFDWIALAIQSQAPIIQAIIPSAEVVPSDSSVDFQAQVIDSDTLENDLKYSWEITSGPGTVTGDTSHAVWSLGGQTIEADADLEIKLTVIDESNIVSQTKTIKIKFVQEDVLSEDESGQETLTEEDALEEIEAPIQTETVSEENDPIPEGAGE